MIGETTSATDVVIKVASVAAPGILADAEVIFKSLDTSGDGKISKVELDEHLLKEGMPQEDIDSLFAYLDKDCSGSVELEELKAGIAQYNKPPPPPNAFVRACKAVVRASVAWEKCRITVCMLLGLVAIASEYHFLILGSADSECLLMASISRDNPSKCGEAETAIEQVVAIFAICLVGLLALETSIVEAAGWRLFGRIYLGEWFGTLFHVAAPVMLAANIFVVAFTPSHVFDVRFVVVAAAFMSMICVLQSPVIRGRRRSFVSLLSHSVERELSLEKVLTVLPKLSKNLSTPVSVLQAAAECVDGEKNFDVQGGCKPQPLTALGTLLNQPGAGRRPWVLADELRFMMLAMEEGAEQRDLFTLLDAAAPADKIQVSVAGLHTTRTTVLKDETKGKQKKASYSFSETVSSALGAMVAQRKGRVIFVVFLSLSLAQGVLTALSAAFIGQLSKAAYDLDKPAFTRNALIYFGLSVGLVGLRVVANGWVMTRARGYFQASLQRRIARRMCAMGADEWRLQSYGTVVKIFTTDVEKAFKMQAKLLSETLSPCCILFITTIYVFTESSTVGTLTMTLYPVILWLTILAAASSALSASAAEAKARATTTEGFTNGLTCQKVIWACNSEDFWCEAFDVKLSAQMRAYITLKATAAYTAEAFRGSVDLFEVLHVCLLGSLVADGSLSSASFIALISLFGKMGADIQKIGKNLDPIFSAAGPFHKIDAFLANHDHDHAHVRGEAPNTASEVAQLSLEQVDFAFSPHSPAVLTGVSLSFEKGQFVCLTGGSGSGKSTLIKLVMGWLCPSAGSIKFKGTETTADSVRPIISTVHQEVLLFIGSVHDNIAFGCHHLGVSRGDVEAAAQLAGCMPFIQKLPKQFDTLVAGPEAQEPSGGQAQRFCLARALCRKPQLLLLDEATSALDPAIEDEIIRNIAGLRNTHADFASLLTISITHRLDTLKYADVVVNMEAGRVLSVIQQVPEF